MKKQKSKINLKCGCAGNNGRKDCKHHHYKKIITNHTKPRSRPLQPRKKIQLVI